CRYEECTGCGLCDFKKIKNRVGGREAGVRRRSRSQLQPKPTLALRRIRLTYSKLNDARFLGHLELSSLFARAIRRAGIPVRYSAGFHPAPRIIFSPPISLGMESMEEFLDVEIEGYMACGEAKDRLNLELPEGIRIIEAVDVPAASPSITAAVTKADYEIQWSGVGSLKIRSFMQSDTFLFKKERTGREYDIRPLIEKFEASDNKLEMTIKTGKEGSIKPGELAQVIFGLGDDETKLLRVVKTRTYLM
ncbi:MAG: TIGR03936 family radical SAM-associated protein, partial [Deltaproteobacteria bacterium]